MSLVNCPANNIKLINCSFISVNFENNFSGVILVNLVFNCYLGDRIIPLIKIKCSLPLRLILKNLVILLVDNHVLYFTSEGANERRKRKVLKWRFGPESIVSYIRKIGGNVTQNINAYQLCQNVRFIYIPISRVYEKGDGLVTVCRQINRNVPIC